MIHIVFTLQHVDIHVPSMNIVLHVPVIKPFEVITIILPCENLALLIELYKIQNDQE